MSDCCLYLCFCSVPCFPPSWRCCWVFVCSFSLEGPVLSCLWVSTPGVTPWLITTHSHTGTSSGGGTSYYVDKSASKTRRFSCPEHSDLQKIKTKTSHVFWLVCFQLCRVPVCPALPGCEHLLFLHRAQSGTGTSAHKYTQARTHTHTCPKDS